MTAPPMVGRAALGVVRGRAVVADELAVALAHEEADEHRGAEERDDERHDGRDEHSLHVSSSLGPASRSPSNRSPASRLDLNSTTSPGGELRVEQRLGARRRPDTSRTRVPVGRRMPGPRRARPGGQCRGGRTHDDELVDTAGDDLGTDLGVQGVGLVAELEHGAEHRPGAATLPHMPSISTCCAGPRCMYT